MGLNRQDWQAFNQSFNRAYSQAPTNTAISQSAKREQEQYDLLEAAKTAAATRPKVQAPEAITASPVSPATTYGLPEPAPLSEPVPLPPEGGATTPANPQASSPPADPQASSPPVGAEERMAHLQNQKTQSDALPAGYEHFQALSNRRNRDATAAEQAKQARYAELSEKFAGVTEQDIMAQTKGRPARGGRVKRTPEQEALLEAWKEYKVLAGIYNVPEIQGAAEGGAVEVPPEQAPGALPEQATPPPPPPDPLAGVMEHQPLSPTSNEQLGWVYQNNDEYNQWLDDTARKYARAGGFTMENQFRIAEQYNRRREAMGFILPAVTLLGKNPTSQGLQQAATLLNQGAIINPTDMKFQFDVTSDGKGLEKVAPDGTRSPISQPELEGYLSDMMATPENWMQYKQDVRADAMLPYNIDATSSGAESNMQGARVNQTIADINAATGTTAAERAAAANSRQRYQLAQESSWDDTYMKWDDVLLAYSPELYKLSGTEKTAMYNQARNYGAQQNIPPYIAVPIILNLWSQQYAEEE